MVEIARIFTNGKPSGIRPTRAGQTALLSRKSDVCAGPLVGREPTGPASVVVDNDHNVFSVLGVRCL